MENESEIAGAAPAQDDDDSVQDENEGAKLCGWCGASNPLDVTRCVACNAVFPSPEGEAAVQKAADARINDLMEDISAQTRRPRPRWRWRLGMFFEG